MTKLVDPHRELMSAAALKTGERDGIVIEKSVALNEEWVKRNKSNLESMADWWLAYPDLFLDLIKPSDSEFDLFFYQRIFLRATMRYKEVYVCSCLKGNTPILTERGMVPIKDFNLCDRVWSDGEWHEVENLNRREWRGDLCQISADNCFEDTIITTDDHKFLTVRRKNRTTRPGTFWKEGLDFFNIDYEKRREFYRRNLREVAPQWVAAKDLSSNDWLLSSIDTEVRDTEVIKTKAPPKKATNLIPSEIELNNDFYEWLGIWLAEGGWGEHQIVFTISTEEERLKNRIIELSKKIFGLTPHVYIRKNHSQTLVLNSAHLSQLFSQLFQCEPNEMNQWNKWIPQILIHCEPQKQLQLVKGWLDGDGYYRKTGNSSRYKGTTVSSQLCEGVKSILYRNFVNPSITTEIRSKKAKVYNINFNGPLAAEFKDAIDNNRPVQINDKMRLGEYYPLKCGDKLYMRNRVREIKILPPDDEDVYCLQMENEQFCTNGVEGHNCRAFSKTFISILAEFLQCVFIPGTRRFIVAPHKNQAAGIAKQKIEEIYLHWPLLKKEVIGWELNETPGNFGKDYVNIRFRNGSVLDVVGGDGARGLRRHGGLLDEVRDADEVEIQEVIIPLMNVSRRLPDDTVNPKEPNQQQIICTSAGVKSSYAYERLIDCLENSIIDPQNSFVFGCDYRVPAKHGLIDANYINKLKSSPSYDEQAFAREYLSIWGGSSEDSWYNFDKLSRYRRIKNPEMHAKRRLGSNQFYLISVDVGRLHDQSVATVFKVTISKEGRYVCSVVNIEVLGKTPETRPFKVQALDIKKMIDRYNPREVVIDCNGLTHQAI